MSQSLNRERDCSGQQPAMHVKWGIDRNPEFISVTIIISTGTWDIETVKYLGIFSYKPGCLGSTPRPAEQPSTVIKYSNPQVTLLRQHRDRPRFREETHCHKDDNDYENDTSQPAMDRTSSTPDLLQCRRWCSSPGVPAGANDDITRVLSRATQPETC